MKLSKILMVVAMASLFVFCRADDDGDDDDISIETGNAILDAIAELAPSSYAPISSQISAQGQAPDNFIEAQSPATVAALQGALAPFGINANAPAPELEEKIEALSPEAALTMVVNVISALAATPDDDSTSMAITGRKMK